MQAYLVRHKSGCSEGKPNSIVGVFVANSLSALRCLTDQATDPSLCEYICLGEGGFVWLEESSAVPVPPGEDEEGDDNSYVRLFSGCVPDEGWHGKFLFAEDLVWKPLVEKGMYLPGRGVVDADDPVAASVGKMLGCHAV